MSKSTEIDPLLQASIRPGQRASEPFATTLLSLRLYARPISTLLWRMPFGFMGIKEFNFKRPDTLRLVEALIPQEYEEHLLSKYWSQSNEFVLSDTGLVIIGAYPHMIRRVMLYGGPGRNALTDLEVRTLRYAAQIPIDLIVRSIDDPGL